jgi:hypothetical protein
MVALDATIVVQVGRGVLIMDVLLNLSDSVGPLPPTDRSLIGHQFHRLDGLFGDGGLGWGLRAWRPA